MYINIYIYICFDLYIYTYIDRDTVIGCRV